MCFHMEIDFVPKFVMIWKVTFNKLPEHMLETHYKYDTFFKTRSDAEKYISKVPHNERMFYDLAEILAVQQERADQPTRYYPFDTAVVFRDL